MRDDLITLARSLRKKRGRKKTITDGQLEDTIPRPKSWFNPAMLHGSAGHELAMILITNGCNHHHSKAAGCFMCGYNDGYDADVATCRVPGSAVLAQFKQVMKEHQDALKSHDDIVLKIFHSGSFLDDREVSPRIREEMLKISAMEPSIKEIAVESRPEHVSAEGVNQVLAAIRDDQFLEVGIGLETWNDVIRETCINKGFTFEDFLEAHHVLEAAGAGTKVYLFLKPLLLSEAEACLDLINSVQHITRLQPSTISINPAAIHSGTVMEFFYHRRQYRPPWLYSVQLVVSRALHALKNNGNTLLICDPVAGGKKRGAHNCLDRHCNNKALDIIRESIFQQASLPGLDPFTIPKSSSFSDTGCSCLLEWMDLVHS
ncbi:TIGR01210 family radical SAM protein [Candidatus Bathyarchaeota archaeon]|nr:TIGR01210 family radical SAM protein [Candidatus Bathyarchaeota archaeon]